MNSMGKNMYLGVVPLHILVGDEDFVDDKDVDLVRMHILEEWYM